MDKNTKILFIHNTAMWYRIPFFRKLSEKYDMDLIFTHFDVINTIYNEDKNKKIEGLEDVNYEILENTHGYAKDLTNKLNPSYDVIIGGSWDTLPELIETIQLQRKAKKLKIPFIIWREDWDWTKNKSIKQKALNYMIHKITTNAEAILVPGSKHKEYFINLGVKPEDIIIMPNVSNIEGSNNTQPNEEVKTILYVGRLIERKGVKYLLEAFKQLEDKYNNLKLVIVGEGDQENSLKKQATGNVTFTGKIDNNKLKNYYQKANIVVVPSTDDGMGDPWVFVINEAMSYSKPVVATNAVGAAYDMIDGNGFIVDQKNPDQLASAIEKILTDEKLEKSMGVKSKKIINENYQYSNMIDAFNHAIKKVRKL